MFTWDIRDIKTVDRIRENFTLPSSNFLPQWILIGGVLGVPGGRRGGVLLMGGEMGSSGILMGDCRGDILGCQAGVHVSSEQGVWDVVYMVPLVVARWSVVCVGMMHLASTPHIQC